MNFSIELEKSKVFKMEFNILSTQFNESVKNDVLSKWIKNTVVISTLQKYHINPSFFSKHFGTKILDYAVGVITKEKPLGNCPVVGVMLEFFEKKEIPLDDVFLICVNLKNSLIEYFLEKGNVDKELFFEIYFLMDQNFIGVIKEYNKEKIKTCSLFEKKDIEIVKNDIYIDNELLDELIEIEEDVTDSLSKDETFSEKDLGDLIICFQKYDKLITSLYEFEEISYSLNILIKILKETSLEEINLKGFYFRIYLIAIIGDFSAWRKNIFENKINDIHYLDKSILANMAQVEMVFSENEIEGDIDFF